MVKDYGYEWEVSVYSYYKVAMAKRTDADEIEEESFNATCRLFEHESDVDVLDNQVQKVEQGDKYFTFASSLFMSSFAESVNPTILMFAFTLYLPILIFIMPTIFYRQYYFPFGSN